MPLTGGDRLQKNELRKCPMPVALPPPTQPVLQTLAQVPRNAAVVRARKAAVEIQLMGIDDIDAAELQTLLQQADTVEKVIFALRDHQYRRGRLASRLAYAVDGKRVYVWSVDRPIRRVVGDAQFRRFFEESRGAFDLNEFERGRVLASAHADRVALSVQPRFTDLPGNQTDLELLVTPTPDARRRALTLALSNHGSRYSGEHLIAANYRHASYSGSEYAVGGRASPSWINDSGQDNDFYEVSGAYSRIAPGGMFGLSLRSIRFTTTQSGFDFSGTLHEAGLETSQVLQASMDRRTLLRLKLGASDRRTDFEPTGEEIFSEQYASVEANPSYSQSFGALRADLGVTLTYAHALEDPLNSLAADSFYTARPLLRLEWTQTSNAALSLTGIYQYASDTVSELQQWTLGGPGALSAYEPATLVGDTGYVLRLNQNFRWPADPSWTLLLDLFVERGVTEPHEDSPSLQARAHATDVGASLQAEWRKRFIVSVSSAVPISDSELPEDARSEAYASMALSF